MSDPKDNTEALLPHKLVTQLVPRLHAIADALRPTEAMCLIVNSDTALQHPKLMQYVSGTEHLELAIAYLEHAINVNTTEGNASLNTPDAPETQTTALKTYVACVWNEGELGDESKVSKVPLERQVFQAANLAEAQVTASEWAATYSGEVEWEVYQDADETVPPEA